MNILGIGTDICNSKRIQSLLKKNNKFKNKIFTIKEINKSKRIKKKHLFFAKRFAAKEVFSKALGIGISRGIQFKDIEVINNNYGKPKIKLLGQTAKITSKILKRKKFGIHLSLSDDFPFAIATVILTK